MQVEATPVSIGTDFVQVVLNSLRDLMALFPCKRISSFQLQVWTRQL